MEFGFKLISSGVMFGFSFSSGHGSRRGFESAGQTRSTRVKPSRLGSTTGATDQGVVSLGRFLQFELRDTNGSKLKSHFWFGSQSTSCQREVKRSRLEDPECFSYTLASPHSWNDITESR
ncbi:hypothetical protein HanPSC8_Chr12g0528671 [Helianthus annuus]|nr:hypothetical protein HanPSC8_Chr12g0528671 [Helianthus annuus]